MRENIRLATEAANAKAESEKNDIGADDSMSKISKPRGSISEHQYNSKSHTMRKA